MMTLSKRMLPVRLGAIKRAVYMLAMSGAGQPTAATANAASATAAPLAFTDTAVAPSTAAAPLAFTDTAVADVIADIEAQAAAPPRRLPQLPVPAPPSTPTGKAPPATGRRPPLADRRAQRGLRPGQLDPAAAPPRFDHRTRELLERKSYLRNFWYAAALSEAVPDDKPLGVDILGGRIVLFRGEDGRVVALDDTCPHR
jgi:Rieske [2Fe-2S] domain